MRPQATRRGFTLAEMLVYMAVLGILLTVAWLTYYACWDHSLGVLRNCDDIARAVAAGERWRDDVRAATVEPALADGVLRIPRQGGDVSYRFGEKAVERRVGDGAWEPALKGVTASRMVLDQGKHVRSWRWELELKTRRKQPRVRPLFTFRAVAGRGTP